MSSLFKRKSSLTKIEFALFRGHNRVHAITDCVITDDCITLKIAPVIESGGELKPDNKAVIEAKFNNVHIKSKEVNKESPDVNKYPWSIIGFDSDPGLNNKWFFCLCTNYIEVVFESDWPEIKAK